MSAFPPRTELPHPGNVRYEITDLYPDNYHMVQIRAHNNFGLSEISSIVIKTAKGERGAIVNRLSRVALS